MAQLRFPSGLVASESVVRRALKRMRGIGDQNADEILAALRRPLRSDDPAVAGRTVLQEVPDDDDA